MGSALTRDPSTVEAVSELHENLALDLMYEQFRVDFTTGWYDERGRPIDR